MYSGVLSIAISPKFRCIFIELSRLRSRFSNFHIDLIHPDDRAARPKFLHHVVDLLNVLARRKKLEPEDFF